MSEDPTQVVLGDQTYTLAPQRIGRIGRKLTAVMGLFGAVQSGELPTDVAPLYEALKVFIPDLAPQWKLAGYASAEAYGARAEYEKKLAKARDDFARETRGLREFTDEQAVAGLTWDDLTEDEQAAFEVEPFEDPYDEAADKSPTPPEIMDAIESIFQLHGGQRLVRLLRNFVTPETIQIQLKRMVLEAALARSRSSQPGNGASPPTPSTMPGPTSETSTDTLASLQPDS